MATLFREAPFGQLSRLILGPRVFTYVDERRDFLLPDSAVVNSERLQRSTGDDLEKSSSLERNPTSHDFKDNVVDWYHMDDPDNPQNWSARKKTFTFFQICLLTFAGL